MHRTQTQFSRQAFIYLSERREGEETKIMLPVKNIFNLDDGSSTDNTTKKGRI